MFGVKKVYIGILLACAFLMVMPFVFAAERGIVNITFDLERISGSASNQYAVWIEDGNGNYVRTLSVTRFAANGGFNMRPDTLPTWVKVSNNGRQTDVDAVSTATPGTGTVTVQWDGKDSQGQVVPPGTYVYKIEGNISWEKRVIWTGTIFIGQGPNSSVANVEYIPDKETATPRGLLITNVKASCK